jgi:hypothetical protein
LFHDDKSCSIKPGQDSSIATEADAMTVAGIEREESIPAAPESEGFNGAGMIFFYQVSNSWVINK